MHALIFLAFALGVMLSPETLILLGNTLGREGRAALSGLLVAGGLHVLTARTYGRLGLHPAARAGESRLLHAAFGPLVATVLPLCARVIYTVAAATGILAIAGYVFNEVFVYWFPNLGFSFCLLGIVVGLTLAGPRVATLAQLSYVTLALGGVLCLTALGLLELGQAPSVSESTASSSVVTVQGLLAGLLLFVGFELALFTAPYTGGMTSPPGRLMVLSLVLAALIFCGWGVVSMHWVAPARLAESTVPHMVAARAIGGANGRVVMGVVVLAGTCAAVHALLSAGSHMLAGMAMDGLLPTWLGWRQARPALLVLATGPAAMLAMGMAGEPETEVYTRAGVLFWLLHYAAMHLAVLVGQRQTPQTAWGRGTTAAVVSLLSLGALTLGVVGLIWLDREATHLLVFMGLAGAGASGLSLAWLGWRRCWQRWHTAVSTCHGAHSTGKHASCKGETL